MGWPGNALHSYRHSKMKENNLWRSSDIVTCSKQVLYLFGAILAPHLRAQTLISTALEEAPHIWCGAYSINLLKKRVQSYSSFWTSKKKSLIIIMCISTTAGWRKGGRVGWSEYCRNSAWKAKCPTHFRQDCSSWIGFVSCDGIIQFIIHRVHFCHSCGCQVVLKNEENRDVLNKVVCLTSAKIDSYFS